LQAKWELKTRKKVKRVCFDGAGELGGCLEFLEELALDGIEVEVVAVHEHWKNGRIEWYMRTIEEKIHAMLVTTQLPMTYWGEAALTAAYLQNLTSMSTLPMGVTPFEVFSDGSQTFLIFGFRGRVALPWFPKNSNPN
jgi:hypothetical protein